jgi:hypothetical protein
VRPKADSESKSISGEDLAGEYYEETIARLHRVLRPKTYMEIGVFAGATLALASCPSIAVDPGFEITDPEIFAKILLRPQVSFYRMPSDDFFAAHDPREILKAPVDMVFLDGMHRCEFLLRDFINTEKVCKTNSVVILHDCVPVDDGITARVPHGRRGEGEQRSDWWTGDVWRTALLLKRRRPDLVVTALDASPTGLVIITNLDPSSRALSDSYQACVRDMMNWHIPEIGIEQLHAALGLEPTSGLMEDEQITARFWL